MKKFMAMAVLMFIGVAGWHIGERLSSDALSMALGVLFGVMSGVPAVLMVLAAHRRENEYHSSKPRNQQVAAPPYTQQPPVIVLAAPQQQGQPYGDGYAVDGYPQRHIQERSIEPSQFMIAQQEDWVDEW